MQAIFVKAPEYLVYEGESNIWRLVFDIEESLNYTTILSHDSRFLQSIINGDIAEVITENLSELEIYDDNGYVEATYLQAMDIYDFNLKYKYEIVNFLISLNFYSVENYMGIKNKYNISDNHTHYVFIRYKDEILKIPKIYLSFG